LESALGKLALVKQKVTDKGGRQQVRWEVAQYKIKQALAASGKALEGFCWSIVLRLL
jgi:hypothetical protein